MKRNYRWDLGTTDEDRAAELARKLKLPLLVARLLVSRGLSSPEAAAAFLGEGTDEFHDPFGMKHMDKAVERIRRALRDGERILVYGDYDADGVTSTALMIRLLRRLNGQFDTYIPHRSLEGYGLNLPAVDRAKENGVTLIVTVDNGISAVEQIAYAGSLGIDVVVTDHHEPPAVLPEAVALVNPKQADCGYPFKGLSGAGVAFKLAHALLGRMEPELADVAAIGTVADLMPLVGENRALVRLGLERMNAAPTPGVRALASISGAEPGQLSSGRIAFGLAPRLNAGGRLERADGAVRLLVTEDENEAGELALRLDELNVERQRLVDETVEAAEHMWQERVQELSGRAPEVIAIAGRGWNAGIAGLVAAKMVERHYKPAIILAEDEATGLCKGSARSIDGFDLYAALTECAEWMEHFGGHQAAAGLTMRREHLADLEREMSRLARERILPDDWTPKKKADLVCGAAELTLEAAEALKRLEPFGNANPAPRLAVRGAFVTEARAIGKEGKHLRLVAEAEGRRLETVGFGMGEEAGRLLPDVSVDLLGELSVNEWNGRSRVQLVLQDWRFDAFPVYDCRKERDFVQGVRLRAKEEGRCLVLCASAEAKRELLAAEEAGRTGAVYALYREWTAGEAAAGEASGSEPSAAAASEADIGSETEKRQQDAVRLVLAGLPQSREDAEGLKSALSAERRPIEAVYIYAAPAGSGARIRAFPDRQQFGRVYTLFRKQAKWIDGPDGFLRQVSEAVGWPLSVVRMMQDVFAELGFLTVDRSNVTVHASPPRRELDQSPRYRREKEYGELAALGSLGSRELADRIRKIAEIRA
ncbi:single-stranded-DNA-specific exonuclease RecJ [Cohnella massiliensis]|uniref:single-stranded-DNA-specific exonuclease RecJ n=1 Tax=Cohnella massiliensis TaxID=1816691 RepID=UPI001594D5DB|nr:single-stranded-DNA-specific exonuclease RecJ [Cohnella massiliensis]